jgi:hypothetical protein
MAALSLTTATVQASNSGGLALKNSGGTTQMLLGGGGGDNITLSVATNITPANAAVAISPTGTGTVTLNPATASTINNMSIGATTALAGRFTDVTLTTGNLIVASGQGIDFSATSHPAGMTSELLNDYEEGTWTPTLGGTATYLAQIGRYTKVGRLVYIQGTLYINAIGTGTTSLVSGLPFTAVDAHPITVQIGGSAQAFSAVYGYIGTTNVNITYNAALAVSNQTAANVFTALTYIDFSGCYSV